MQSSRFDIAIYDIDICTDKTSPHTSMNDSFVQRDVAIEGSGGAEDTVAADHGRFDHLSAGKVHDQRDDAAMGKVDLRDRIAGLGQHRLTDQFHGPKMRAKQFRRNRSQRCQQTIGRVW